MSYTGVPYGQTPAISPPPPCDDPAKLRTMLTAAGAIATGILLYFGLKR